MDNDTCNPNDNGDFNNLLEVTTYALAIILAAKHDPMWLVFCLSGAAFLTYREVPIAIVSGVVAAGLSYLFAWQTSLPVEYNYLIVSLLVSLSGSLAAAFLLMGKEILTLFWEAVKRHVFAWPKSVVWGWAAMSLGYLVIAAFCIYYTFFGNLHGDYGDMRLVLASCSLFSSLIFVGVVSGFWSRRYLLHS